jgi:hypothetical protein
MREGFMRTVHFTIDVYRGDTVPERARKSKENLWEDN